MVVSLAMTQDGSSRRETARWNRPGEKLSSGTFLIKTSGGHGFMTTSSTPRRSIPATVWAVAVSFSLIGAIGARAADPGQDDGNKSKKMIKTASGLQYRDDKEGTGATPKTGQTCVVHYTGWLWVNEEKGKKFDTSVDRGQPFSFRVGEGEVIKGWDEGVASMKPGGKRHLLIPPDLGYGARGAAGVIPPNATLFFEVELISVR
jgi:peptidylprolyl isomerase